MGRRLAALAALGCCLAAFGGESALEETGVPEAAAAVAAAPADVYLAVLRLQVHLGALRYVVEGTELDAPPWTAGDALPRHAFGQAQLMFRRVGQLADEMAGGRSLPLAPGDWSASPPRPAPEGREISDADVLQVVADAQARIRALLELRNIHVVVEGMPARDAATSQGDVLEKIVQASRQASLLLERDAPLQDIHRSLTYALNWAGDLLDGRYPPAEAPARGIEPSEVYQRMIDCMRLLQSVQTARSIQTLNLNLADETRQRDIPLASLDDLASLLASELAHLAQSSGVRRRPLPLGEYRMPRNPQPHHLHRLAGTLETQLGWLAAPSSEAEEAEPSSPEEPSSSEAAEG